MSRLFENLAAFSDKHVREADEAACRGRGRGRGRGCGRGRLEVGKNVRCKILSSPLEKQLLISGLGLEGENSGERGGMGGGSVQPHPPADEDGSLAKGHMLRRI